jgi:hypothetical protein
MDAGYGESKLAFSKWKRRSLSADDPQPADGGRRGVPSRWPSLTDTVCLGGEGAEPSDLETPLLPDAKLFDEAAIPLEVLALQIVQQPPALADQLHEPPPGMMVFGVGLEVLGQIADPLAEDGNLDLG